MRVKPEKRPDGKPIFGCGRFFLRGELGGKGMWVVVFGGWERSERRCSGSEFPVFQKLER